MGVLDRVQSCPLNMQYHLLFRKTLIPSSVGNEDFCLIVELGGNNSQGHREVVWGTGQNFPTGPYVIIVKQDYIALYCILSSTDTARIYIIG
jgi:hypothetical protein